MLSEKLKFLQESGRIHLFNIGNLNLLYSRENNSTYQIDNDVFSCLSTAMHSTEQEFFGMDEFFRHLKQDVKPIVNFYTLDILTNINFALHIDKIKLASFTFEQAEIVFKNFKNRNDEIFSQMNLAFNNLDKNDLIFIKEQYIQDKIFLNESSDIDKNTGNTIYYIDQSVKISDYYESDIPKQIKIEYNYSDEADIYKFLSRNDYLTFYVKNDDQVPLFANFLLATLNDTSGINKKIYNLQTIANFLISHINFTRTIEVYDSSFSFVKSPTCDKCWAKNVCWVTKTFDHFNVNLLSVNNYVSTCNLIRNLIENVILRLRLIENGKQKKQSNTFEFQGTEIKLIN